MERMTAGDDAGVYTKKQRTFIQKIFRTLFYPITHRFSLLKTLFFNFKYFPAHVAIRLPVFVYRGVSLISTKGWLELDMETVETGCIRIGEKSYGFHTRHHRTIWEQKGGTVVAGKGLKIGKGTFISVGRFGLLRFGNNIHFGGNSKIICNKSITIQDHTMVAWNVQLIDTDFHRTINAIFKTPNLVEKPITIGAHNWIGFGSVILKGAVTPDNCIVAAKTILKSDYLDVGENVVLSQENPAKVIAKYIQFDENNVVESSEWEDIDNLIIRRNKRRAI